MNKWQKEKADFLVLEKKVEASKKEFQEKQKAAELENMEKKQAKDESQANQIQRDSAALATPKPAATFQIKK